MQASTTGYEEFIEINEVPGDEVDGEFFRRLGDTHPEKDGAIPRAYYLVIGSMMCRAC
jgi:hypothetical protein